MKKFLIFIIIICVFIGAIIILSNDIFKVKPTVDTTTETTETTDSKITDETTNTNQESSETESKKIEEFVLYFSDENAMNVESEKREIEVSSETDLKDIIVLIFTELINGSEKEGYYTAIPENTKIISVDIEGRNLILNLSDEFEKDHPGGSAGISMSFGPIVLSMTELEEIDSVRFLINGETVADFKGHITLDEPFTKSDFQELIKDN
jgi:spore germination protein GerM